MRGDIYMRWILQRVDFASEGSYYVETYLNKQSRSFLVFHVYYCSMFCRVSSKLNRCSGYVWQICAEHISRDLHLTKLSINRNLVCLFRVETTILNLTAMDLLSCTLAISTRISADKTPEQGSVSFLGRIVHCGCFVFSASALIHIDCQLRLFCFRRNRSAPVTGLSRLNNIHIGLIRAANTAIYVAALRGCQHLCIRTDSEYLLESVVYMMSGWKRNGWQYRNGEEVENRNDFYELDATVERFAINLKWEYAHSGCYGIECASRLAAESAEIYEIYNL